jgi:hypothetical protein
MGALSGICAEIRHISVLEAMILLGFAFLKKVERAFQGLDGGFKVIWSFVDWVLDKVELWLCRRRTRAKCET